MPKWEIDTRFHFGQYKGLSVQEVYQGTLNPDMSLITGYLKKILQFTDFPEMIWESEFIESVQFENNRFEIIGCIHDLEKPTSEENHMVFGNIQSQLQDFVNLSFKPSFRGSVMSIQKFNAERPIRTVIGGDPEYLVWCMKELEEFQLSNECILQLAKLSICRLVGINIMYVGNETYEYSPSFRIDPPYTF
jgi:hypothetical protein